jgi:NADPH2:quinone reductase
MKAIRIHNYGGVDALVHEDLELPEPKAGEARIKLGAIGVNFIDTYRRTGLYKTTLPLTLGEEGAGVIDAVGPDVTDFHTGDRVVFASQLGAYAEYAIVSVWRLIPVPNELTLQQAAAILLQGMTVHYLTHSTFPLKDGDVALVHAAAGGTGAMLVQVCKMRGARVIGTVSNEAKARVAKEAGCDEVILYEREDFEARVKQLTEGRGVDVVYDSVGKTTFEKSLNCLRRRGMMVLWGAASGPAPLFDPQSLNPKGSLFLTRPTLTHYTADRNELLERANDVLGWVKDGKLKVRIDSTFPLSKAADAHRHIESRAAIGKVILVP